jgi:hypothetical protein
MRTTQTMPNSAAALLILITKPTNRPPFPCLKISGEDYKLATMAIALRTAPHSSVAAGRREAQRGACFFVCL